MSVHPWHIPSKSFIKGEREGIRSCFETLLNPSVGSHTGTIDLSSLSSYITHTVRNISNLFFLFHKFNTPSPSSMETKNPNYLFFFKSRLWETLNIWTDAESSTDIFVSAGVKRGADSNFFRRRCCCHGHRSPRKKKKKKYIFVDSWEH